MSGSRDFLLEIGVEELPASEAASAVEQAPRLAAEAFARQHVSVEADDVSAWVSPRRIAIYVAAVPEVQEDRETVERGPASAAAFDDQGKPTKAATGFAKAKNVDVSELVVKEHEGREFVFAVHQVEGRPLSELLPEISRQIITGISFSKAMHWDGSGLSFSRPVRWLVCKFGDQTLEFDAYGLKSGDTSRGHRFLSAGEVEISSAGAYLDELSNAHVMANQQQRNQVIDEGLEAEAAAKDAAYGDPGGKLSEVLYLVEFPTVLPGSFAEEHLRLPDRVLITAMQSHQRYFPLLDEAGDLRNGFLYVSNGDPACAETITEGNERILEGRIEDAEFSYDKDMERGIETMSGLLDGVVFHNRLGSLADKTERLKKLVDHIAAALGISADAAETAASAAGLAKADLVSVMVQEFPDLEGYIGSVYARMEGFPGDVCRAIEEHYMPTSAGGLLPETMAGALLALADKADNIVGAWSVEELPTGSRDPYGLRRAAAGITAIAESFQLDMDLTDLYSAGHRLYIEQKAEVDKSAALVRSMVDFTFDRMQVRQVERGVPVEIFEGARASGVTSPLRLLDLVRALQDFRGSESFDDLHTAYFRCSKIVAKAGEDISADVDPDLFEDDAEAALLKQIDDLEPGIETAIEERDYSSALVQAAKLRAPVDRFFDDVMVMAEDERLRANRLSLVSRAARLLLELGDPITIAAAVRPDE